MITIANVTDSKWKLYICVAYAIFIIAGLVVMVIFIYMKKFSTDPDFIAIQSNFS